MLLFGVVLGGAERDRTADLVTASHALSHLSYSPFLLKVILPGASVDVNMY